MKAITLRDIPDEIAESIQRQAEFSGASLNKTVIEMLSAAIKPQRRRREFNDLDHLIGRWGPADANEIEMAVDAQRVVDMELWK